MGCGNSKGNQAAAVPINPPSSPQRVETTTPKDISASPAKNVSEPPASTKHVNVEQTTKDVSAPAGPEPSPPAKVPSKPEIEKKDESTAVKPAASASPPEANPAKLVEPTKITESSKPLASPAPDSRSSNQLLFRNHPSVVSWLPQYKIQPATSTKTKIVISQPSVSSTIKSYRNLPSVVSWLPQYNSQKTPNTAFNNYPSVVSWLPQYKPTKPKKTFTLVLIRHGESQWNVENRFTGWVDVPLAATGEAESHRAARHIKEAGLSFDVVYTSVLKRAIKTGMNVLEDLDLMHVPMVRDWRLNERHYGALQGLNKKDTVEKYGEEQVGVWRRSFDVPPPAADEAAAAELAADARYKGVEAGVLPRSESLADVITRFTPLWREVLGPAIRSGRRVLVAAHGNTLRALVKQLDGISEDVIAGLNIPTAVPLVYTLDEELRPVRPPAGGAMPWAPLSGRYLGDEEEIKKAIAGVSAQTKKVATAAAPAASAAPATQNTSATPAATFRNLPSALAWMPQYRPVRSPAAAAVVPAASCQATRPYRPSTVAWLPQYRPALVVAPATAGAKPAVAPASEYKSSMAARQYHPSVVAWMPQYRCASAAAAPAAKEDVFTLVLIRHGESQWNVENRFTGWVDVPLAATGEAESHRAARHIKEAGLSFDVVYTSVLKRAIKTGMNVLEDLDLMHVPMVRDWRLNERHYGALQGLNKKDTVEKYGEEQVGVWRRSFDVPPPAADEAAAAELAADARYKGVEAGVLPRSESLADVIARFTPLWREVLGPAIRSGRRVLVAAHGNTLRALVKQLDGISDDAISGLNIPTAVPLVYKLDKDLRPVRDAAPSSWAPLSGRYLGDEEEIRKAIAGVSNQSKK